MLKKVMLSFVISSACFLTSHGVEAGKVRGEVDLENQGIRQGAVQKFDPKWVPQSPCKGGISLDWKRRAQKHPELYRIVGNTLQFSRVLIDHPELNDSSSDEE